LRFPTVQVRAVDVVVDTGEQVPAASEKGPEELVATDTR
jgi:hypothetical protein